MAGTAGSKYGIVNDSVPLKDNAKSKKRKKLKDLKGILKKKAK